MYRGIIEGFYGKPFSEKQRNILINAISVLPDSAYFYAPKDDPKHRLHWRDEYSDLEWNSLAGSMGGASSFFFSVSPWKFEEDEWEIVRKKLLRALDSGATGLSILFDDVPDESAAFLAEKQLNFARKALNGIETPIILCPSVYCGEFLEQNRYAEEYLKIWREMIPSKWHSFWTGPGVIAKDFSDLKLAEELFGKKPVLWDNILATDYCLRRVYLSGLSDRIPEGYSWFLNPSEIFPVTLHGVMEMKAALGLPRKWPELLGEHSSGWELLKEFHYLPWSTSETGGEVLARLNSAIAGKDIDEAVVWLDNAIPSLVELTETLPGILGGWELLPIARDLYRSFSIIRRALLSDDDSMVALHYFMHTRLPYENPVALLAAEKRGEK